MYNMPRDLASWLEHRRYPLFDEVSINEADRLVEALIYLDQLNHKSITILINSGGGRTEVLRKIYDATCYIKSPIYGLAMGGAMSASFRILQFCHKRLAWENTTLLFHPAMINIYSGKSTGEILKEIRSCRKDHLWHLSLLAKRSGCSMDNLKKWSKEERRFTALEALKYGFIDKIVKKQS